MAGPKRSLRNIINYILVVMGVFALALVWITVDQYQHIVVSEQRHSIELLANHAVSDQLATHEAYLADLGMTMQADEKFRKAYTTEDNQTLQALIADQFHQYFTTTGLVDLQRITIYDADFNSIARASSNELKEDNAAICSSLIARAKARSGVDRNKLFAGMCQQWGLPFHIAILPIGGLTVTGYAAIIANPVNALEQLENLPRMPYQVSLPSGEILFNSANWPQSINTRETLIATHTIADDSGEALFVLDVASDISKMNQRLRDLMLHIFILALLVTALFVLLARSVFRKRIILPLMRLNQHMTNVQYNQDKLGKNIELSGCFELDELSNSFNSMARKLLDAQRELHNKAHTDSLTGLPNREELYNRMEQLVLLSQREGKRFTLLMMDLNEFKQVNDTMGHHAGDELIQQLSGRLTNCLRTSDTVARLGGDEFAILLPTTASREDGVDVAKKIIEHCTVPFVINDSEVTVGVSIGIAIYPETAEDSDYLMRCADKSMYQAKLSRRGYSICEAYCGQHEVCHQGTSSVPLAIAGVWDGS